MSDGTDDEVDELFALPPADFVGARDALAKRLRGAGERDRAADVKGLRRPSLVAWALNQLVRRFPEEARALDDAATAVREAQDEALAGRSAALGPASAELQRTIRGLAATADELIAADGVGAGSHRDEIEAALRAASGDAALLDELRAGRLEQPPAPSGGGFGFAAAFDVDGPGAASTRERRASRGRPPGRTGSARLARARGRSEAPDPAGDAPADGGGTDVGTPTGEPPSGDEERPDEEALARRAAAEVRRRELSGALASAQSQVRKLDRRAERLVPDLAARRAKVDELESQLAAERAELERLEAEVAGLDEERRALRATAEELEAELGQEG